MSISTFLNAKQEGRKLSMVTCYDYTFARLIAKSAVDAVLVGDSAAMVMHGHRTTVHATIELMRVHTEAVVRGLDGKCVIADMPFLSFRKGITTAVDAAQVLMTAGANGVKLEGVDGHEDVIRHLVQSGIPVMGHVGLQPQSVEQYGGYHVQGRSRQQAQALMRQAMTLQELGAFSIVLECVPVDLAAEISAGLTIPTIGIGAGGACDGQILVLQDLLGLTLDFHPKFVRTFASVGAEVLSALDSYDRAVKAQQFPATQESFR